MNRNIKHLRTSATKNADAFYKMAMNHPKTSAAVVLGTGAAAALVWLARRNGGFRSLHHDILARVRGLAAGSPADSGRNLPA